MLVEQGADKEEKVDRGGYTPLYVASQNGHLDVVRYLVEQGADMENVSGLGKWTALMTASCFGREDVVRYLLEQGANRDKKASTDGRTSLHLAAKYRHLDIAKLLMVYGADLNARSNNGHLPIDVADTEEIKQAIRDEPRRRMDDAPGKRATYQDRHPNAATSAATLQEDNEGEEEEVEPRNKKPRLNERAEAEEGKVAEEDEDSEPSSDEGDV